MSPEDAHKDLYSVSPAAMSDEQIARRDAECEHAKYYATDSVMRVDVAPCPFCLRDERDALRAVLQEILKEECIPPGFSLLIERAEKLLGEKS